MPLKSSFLFQEILMKNLFLSLWIVFFASCPLHAQNGAAVETPEVKGRVAWFVYTSMPEGVENPMMVMTGKDLVQVTLSKRSPSDPVKIPDDGILRIVRKVENPEDPKKPSYKILAQATIAKEVNKALIILIPAAKNPEGLLFQAGVEDLANFKGGDWLYINMTKLRVGIEMGKTKMELKPSEIKIYNPPSLSEPTNMPIRYNYYNPEKEQWKILSASTVVIYPTRREICIFSWDPRYDRVDYHGITFPVSE
jgi:hypothetical protein